MFMKSAITGAAMALALTAASAFAQDGRFNEQPNLPRDQAVQNEMGLTSLLNQVAALGFADYRSTRREGNRYIIEAMTTDFEIVTITADLNSGQITVQPTGQMVTPQPDMIAQPRSQAPVAQP